MLRALVPQARTSSIAGFVPRIVQPLLDAACSEKSLTDALQCISRELGFDTFMYAVTTCPQPTHDSRSYVWTSLPEDWVRLYDQNSYIEIDPRLRGAWESIVPLVWDRETFPDTAEHRAFFAAAAAFGVRSGVAMVFRNRFHAPAIFVLNSSVPSLDSERRRHVNSVLGQAMIVGSCVHDLLVASVVERCIPPPTQGRPLSVRERACLQLAARGLTSGQIGSQLNIGERTVHQHFSNLLAKLGAANRHEAIAQAAAAGLIES